MGIFDKFKFGLNKSSKNLSSGLKDLIFKKKIDEKTLNNLEDFLIQSDVGVECAQALKEKRNSRTVGEQLSILSKRPGASKKERERLLALLKKNS